MTSAEQTFSSTYNDGYTLTLAQLGGPVGSSNCTNAGLIDEILSTAPIPEERLHIYVHAKRYPTLSSGIPAACGASGDSGYTIDATPLALGSTGTTSYCVDETGVIRVNAAGVIIPAPCSNSGFPPLQ